jgi:hypothetical protein
MGPCVSLNIMWLHLDQASFKMTEAQYVDKLDSVAALCNALGQTDKVWPRARAYAGGGVVAACVRRSAGVPQGADAQR